MELESKLQAKNFLATKAFLLFGIIFVAFNLRPAITSVGPLIGSIKLDLHISNGIAGLITTLPLLSFGFFSYLAPKFGYRFGNEVMIFSGLIALLLGIVIRSTGLLITVLMGTILIGVGIAIGNVLLPSIVKNHFPLKVGLVTGVYTLAMNVFAALGSGLSIPLAEQLSFGWKNALLFWVFVSILALLFWSPQLKRDKTHTVHHEIQSEKGISIWKSRIAWQVTIFMGLQSFLFYSTIAWFPEILTTYGISISQAGWIVSIMQICGLPFAFLTPIVADKMKNQIKIVILLGISYAVGFVLMLLTSNIVLIVIGVMLIGMSQGACISLSLALLSLRSNTSKQAGELSGMAQSVGYTLAAIGPTIVGVFFDLTHGWSIPIALLILVAIIMTIYGVLAGRDLSVEEK